MEQVKTRVAVSMKPSHDPSTFFPPTRTDQHQRVALAVGVGHDAVVRVVVDGGRGGHCFFKKKKPVFLCQTPRGVFERVVSVCQLHTRA